MIQITIKPYIEYIKRMSFFSGVYHKMLKWDCEVFLKDFKITSLHTLIYGKNHPIHNLLWIS